MGIFIINKTADDKFFFTFEINEGEPLITSATYQSLYSCKSAIQCLRNSVPKAGIIEEGIRL